MKKVVLVLSFIPALLSAQCTIEVADTFSCTPGSMLVLDAVTFDAFDTENYTISNIPYSPVSGLKTQSLTIGDDQTIGPFHIGFNFNFFNLKYVNKFIFT